MEKPKILGIAEKPTQEDLRSGRTLEDASPLHALRDLVKNPEKTKLVADLVTYPPLSKKLHAISLLDRSSDEYEAVLIEAFATRSKCEELEEKIIGKTKESFKEDLFAYLDKLEIEHSKEKFAGRIDHVMVSFLDYVRYFGNIIYRDMDIEEACAMSAYYIADSDSISVNLSGIDGLVARTGVGQEKEEAVQAEIINSTLRHELVHALSYQNFWVTENSEDGGDQTDSRRLGIRGLSIGRERASLTLLNEAITEKLNQETLSPFLPKKDIEIVGSVLAYEKEIEILNALCKCVDWKFFVSACFSKNGLMHLAREVKRRTGLTLSEIDEAMEIDYQDGYKNNHTINLIGSKTAI